ncbi:MAG: hypothetical protein GPOALKHO_001738 [Sodalis sp.]|nr:MAG: hypothetical protein GPOALKHO_001738 [Sodalis sp.]
MFLQDDADIDAGGTQQRLTTSLGKVIAPSLIGAAIKFFDFYNLRDCRGPFFPPYLFSQGNTTTATLQSPRRRCAWPSAPCETVSHDGVSMKYETTLPAVRSWFLAQGFSVDADD